MKLDRRPRRRARIEIIPLIDTVFFLLVFFMMASLSMSVYRGLPVNLPRAATGRTAADQNVAVTVTRDGALFVNEQPVTVGELAERLRGFVAADPGVVVIVNAADDVAHRRVVGALDAARAAGVGRVAIAVTPEAATGRP